MKTDTTLRLTRAEYRAFAETTKSAGMALNLSSFKRMKDCWGTYSPWALLVCRDATKDDPAWHERALITLATAINTASLRACGPGRPEVDWSVLDDHEIYPFVVWHEIGHHLDNFHLWRIKDMDAFDECHRRIRFINELLADRYAWNRIRPGEAIPISEHGKCMQEKAQESMEYLEKHAHRRLTTCYPLAAGQYLDVPDYMLDGHHRAAYVGPQVSHKLVCKRMERHRQYREGRRVPLY